MFAVYEPFYNQSCTKPFCYGMKESSKMYIGSDGVSNVKEDATEYTAEVNTVPKNEVLIQKEKKDILLRIDSIIGYHLQYNTPILLEGSNRLVAFFKKSGSYDVEYQFSPFPTDQAKLLKNAMNLVDIEIRNNTNQQNCIYIDDIANENPCSLKFAADHIEIKKHCGCGGIYASTSTIHMLNGSILLKWSTDKYIRITMDNEPTNISTKETNVEFKKTEKDKETIDIGSTVPLASNDPPPRVKDYKTENSEKTEKTDKTITLVAIPKYTIENLPDYIEKQYKIPKEVVIMSIKIIKKHNSNPDNIVINIAKSAMESYFEDKDSYNVDKSYKELIFSSCPKDTFKSAYYTFKELNIPLSTVNVKKECE